MKTIFDKQTQTELIHRINLLDENSQRKWGTMNVFQMLKHNTHWNGWFLDMIILSINRLLLAN